MITPKGFEYCIALVESLKVHRNYINEGKFENGDMPRHDCEYFENPEKGTCDFCEMWATGSNLLGELENENKGEDQ
jgi:hypothetical protein